jgi:integrase
LARKTGQIVGRGRRRWLVRVFLGRDRETRKRRYHNRTIHGPVRNAQHYLNRVLRERDLGRRVEGIAITLNEYLDRFETAAKSRLREKSYRDYRSLLRRYIRPILGERMLSVICPFDVQGTYQRMVERGLSARTVRYTHAVLRSAMRQAIRWRFLEQDPTDGAQLPRLRRREMRVLSAEQSRVFLEAVLKTHYGAVFAIALTTAARPSEYLALKWQDIDWERGTVSVRRTLERGPWRFAETKRARSRRVIKLQEWVLGLLRDLHSKMNANPGCNICPGTADLIFTNPSGRPIHSDKLAKKFKSILEQAGLPLIRLYDLRHTGATLALATGVPPKVVSEQLGMPARHSLWTFIRTCSRTCRSKRR